ncbi:MAG: GNAT family N-acetyltransferase [Thaumarchaeota archaeon]|nr:GNAT family N-acetyltransferase [Nitrososphaerota archaeon]
MGKLVTFRALEEDDLPKMRDWRNSKYVKRTTREYQLLNMFNQKSWFESLHKQRPPRDIMFSILNKKGKLIGVCGLTYIDWKNRHSEISIYLEGEKWQYKNETRDALKILISYAFGEINLHKVFAEIYSFVIETIHLYESMGFHKDGVLRDNVWRSGRWWNSFVYSTLDVEFKNEKD